MIVVVVSIYLEKYSGVEPSLLIKTEKVSERMPSTLPLLNGKLLIIIIPLFSGYFGP